MINTTGDSSELMVDNKELFCHATTGEVYDNTGAVLHRFGRSEVNLLLAFVDNYNGSFLSRESLIALGWPRKVVSNGSLPVSIKKIRDGLAKLNSNLRIENQSGFGYRLCGPKETPSPIEIINEWKEGEQPHYSEKKLPINENISETLQNIEKNTTLHHTKKFTIQLKYVIIFLLSFVMWVAVINGFFISVLPSEEHCYSFAKNINVCGIYSLTPQDITSLKNDFKSNNLTGEFIYGYDSSIKKIKLYPIY